MRFLFSLVIFFSLCVQPVAAQVNSNDFRIRLNGPEDTEPPSTPTLLSVTPSAYDQIDLEWDASTDNAIVSGYVVSRDGTSIATTTQLTYADTGLNASTTYSYTVRAFDPSYNYSSSSNALAATTPAAPVMTSSGSGGATAAKVVIENFSIETGVSTTSFSLLTTHQSRLEVRWGRTSSYELGYIVGDVFAREHSLLITDLEPGTTYKYEIIGYTPAGFETVLKQSSFETKSINVSVSPPNVSWFEAIRSGVDVDLRWELPTDTVVDQVRIVRSHFGFPQSPQDGAIIYQGLNTMAHDGQVLAQYSPVYYTAFLYDAAGNVSTGAVAIVYAASGVSETGSSTTPIEPVEAATSTVNEERVLPEIKMPILTDIVVMQDTLRTTFDQPGITLDATKAFTLSIPKSAVARNLKSIIATITDPQDTTKQQSFLLRINKAGTAYEAQMPRVVVSGTAQIKIIVYDYEAFVVATYQAPVNFLVPVTTKRAPVFFPDVFITYIPPTLFGLGLLLLLLILWMLIKRPLSRRPAEGT
ncbi:MAG: fibronectin type III domain-containing protein [Candidatus Pacebacteria bacterium]|nr:fibronectin type III domain-containing protein [Candidatus Paceibacterota bacterium]